MKTKLKIAAAIAFAVLFGAKAFGQEWEYTIPYQMSDSVMIRRQDAQ